MIKDCPSHGSAGLLGGLRNAQGGEGPVFKAGVFSMWFPKLKDYLDSWMKCIFLRVKFPLMPKKARINTCQPALVQVEKQVTYFLLASL